MGAGAVGRSVVALAGEHGHDVVAVADSQTAVVDDDGLDAQAVLNRKSERGSVGDADPGAALDAEYDVLVEATPTTLDDAEPGFGHVARALERDRDVVLANKGPVAERYADVADLEAESAGRVRFEATVAGAIPVLGTIEDYGRSQVTAAKGIFNGTANFVLSRMAAEGLSYEHVLAEAQDLGVAEADPTFDVDGTDAALKCVILANVLADGDATYTLDDADVEGIRSIPPSALDLAAEDGRTVRLVGEATAEGARVGPRLVPESGPLAVTGTQNVVQLDTDAAGALELGGRGAGGDETASAVLADVRRLED
nr:homoserine dehydrogenase [Halorubellus salinus]